MELTWEALEYGGQIPERIAGSDCSVYIGISGTDYANSQFDDPSVADGYFMTGNTLSIAANRISNIFDLRGPSMAIDTACSSSLVALHQACTSIWNAESSSALIGAVHLLLSPFPFIGFSKASMLSETGTCKVFDAYADGYVRSEGGAVLYLKPLAQARADGDPIQALILETAVNTDGHNSGLTIPNGAAQKMLLERAYQSASIPAERVAYIEAHGTGTPVGDPIEADAIGSVIGKRRDRGSPIPIGSVKSNIGHLEPASGIAGLIKVILSLKHRGIPASINFDRPNPNIDFDGLNLQVVDQFIPLDETNDPLIMGVNSFGFGGSNAHTILGEYRPDNLAASTAPRESYPPLFLSANSEDALVARADQIAKFLQSDADGQDIYDVLYTAANRRQNLRYGLTVRGTSRAALVEQLQAFSNAEATQNLITAERVEGQDRVAFVFSGNGSQWAGMGLRLLKLPKFKRCVAQIDEFFVPLAGWSVEEEFRSDPANSRLEFTEIAQPTLFALQVGLTTLLRQHGVTPEAVIGHSVGEIAAAHIAGSLTLEQAVGLVYYRSKAQGKTKGRGKMLAARVSPDAVTEILTDHPAVELAAINSPDSITLAGRQESIEALAVQLGSQDIYCRILDLDYAFHSTAMDEVETEFATTMGTLHPQSTNIDFVSTVTGAGSDGTTLDTRYWWRNIRAPVLFQSGVQTLIDDEFGVFIEIGPHPVLQTYLREILNQQSSNGMPVAVLRRDTPDESAALLAAVDRTYLLSAQVDRAALFPHAGRLKTLPPYPWRRSEYRFRKTEEPLDTARDHALLGFRVKHLDGVWINQIDPETHPFLKDHVVDGLSVFPAAAFAEIGLAASARLFGRHYHEIAGLEIRRPLVFELGVTKETQVDVSPEDFSFTVRSRSRLSGEAWLLNAVGRLVHGAQEMKPTALAPELLLPPSGNQLSIEGAEVYRIAAALGLQYGPSFQRITQVWVGDQTVSAHLQPLPGDEQSEYELDPAIIDAAFHSLLPASRQQPQDIENTSPFLPLSIGGIRKYSGCNRVQNCRCTVHSRSARGIDASFVLGDDAGHIVAEISHCVFRELPRRSANPTPTYYSYRQVPKNHIDASAISPLPSLEKFSGSSDHPIPAGPMLSEDHILGEQVLPLYDALASALAERTLKQIGAHLGGFTIDSLLSESGIHEKHRRFVTFLMNVLEEDSKAHCEDGVWHLISDSEDDDAVAIWRSILADHPRYLLDMLLTARRGFKLLPLLVDNGDVEELAVAEGGVDNPHRAQLDTVLNVIRQINKTWPKNRRRLRIAEFRGQTGSNFSPQILALLHRDYCDYELIVSDQGVKLEYEQRLRNFANAKVTWADSEHAYSTESEYRNGEFDLVISNEWLHQCPDILKSLAQVTQILATGGMMLLVERRPDRLADINRGIDPDWWSRSLDEDRPASRLMDPDEWLIALEKAGFSKSRLLPGAVTDERHAVVASTWSAASKQTAKESSDHRQTWLLLSDASHASLSVAELLKEDMISRGDRALLIKDGSSVSSQGIDEITLNTSRPGDFDYLLEHLHKHNIESTNLVFLLGLELAEHPTTFQSTDTQSRRCMALAHLLRAFEQSSPESRPRFWVVTSGATGHHDVMADSACKPTQATLWGFGRVVRNEFPLFDFRMVDLQTKQSTHTIARFIMDELLNPDDEDEIILHDEVRSVLRLDRSSTLVGDLGNSSNAEGSDTFYRLDFDPPANLDRLEWKLSTRCAPGKDEVEIEAKAAGLNFRDVMYASGLLPEEMLQGGLAGATLGLECAGVITAVGATVTELQVGDEVMCFAPQCFASHVIAPTSTVMLKPAHWSFFEAATVPTTFFTAYYALHSLAHLRAGERVLIHGAAGGVGLAAIQIARHLGAEIFATAGTEEKRNYLRLLGTEHVLDSRTLTFASEIMDITHDEGVDVVLNSLAGEAIDKNFSVLRPFGRFIELGKRDFLENRRVGLRPFRNNISYFGVDADQLMGKAPDLCRDLLNDLMALFDARELRPLVHTIFPADDVASAFRFMQQSKQIGKVVIDIGNGTVQASPQQPEWEPQRLSEDATYLITGGLGGFGLATAQWMASRGARNIVLLGRSGTGDPGAIAPLRDAGVNVKPTACDVSDPVALQKVLREIKDQLPPLRGIVHAAMVLDDCTIRNMTAIQLTEVLKPKVQGAWNLHKLTLDDQLDFFVMYSSATTYIGNPGQANYVAANAYLEGLARYRAHAGRPATAIAWDALTDTGYLARNPLLRDALSRVGINGITTAQALDALDHILSSEITETAVLNVNWKSAKKHLPIAKTPKFSYLTHGISDEDLLGGDQDIRELIAGLSADEISALIKNMLIEEVSNILHLPPDRLDHNRSLQEIGVDSLMAMEMGTAVEERFGVDLPVMSLAGNATIETIAGRVATALTRHNSENDGDEDTSGVESLANTHAESISSQDIQDLVREVDDPETRPTRLTR